VPGHAHDALLSIAGRSASLIAEQLDILLLTWNQPTLGVGALPREIRTTLNALQATTAEAARERRSRLADEPDPEPLYRTLARLHFDVVALGRIVSEPWPAEVHDRLSDPFSEVVVAAADLLRKTGTALSNRQAPESLDAVTRAIAGYEDAVDDIRKAGLTKDLPTEAVGRVFALGFVLDQFRRNLEDLLGRTAEVSRTRSLG